LLGAWVALLIAICFFIIGFCWYYGQIVFRRYLHVNDQTTALKQLSHRLGLDPTNESILTTDNEQLSRKRSLPVEHQTASSDEEDENRTDPAINILPPIDDENGSSTKNRISFVNNLNETDFHISPSGNIACTVTPGLGVFLTTSSRHTPHVFERVLARVHAVC
jgi:hypothetical protein